MTDIINRLPDEILIRIFQYYLLNETQLNLVRYLSQVCRRWRELCKDSSIFQSVDGSLTTKTIIRLAEEGSLKKTKSLKFGIQKAKCRSPFNGETFKKFYANLPRLKSLNLTYVCSDFDKKKEHSIFTELKDFCPDLCELVLGHPEINCKATISHTIFEEFLCARGPKLVTLDFSHVNIPGIKKLLCAIANNCPNLEDLIILNLTTPLSHIFPIKQMQVGCPKLKTLRLSFPIILNESSVRDTPGFPQLETFTYPYREDVSLRDISFSMLLNKSPKLNILDIRGCQRVSVEAVHALSAPDLEQLYLSFTDITRKQKMVKLLQKWSHSLRVVDLSHTTGRFFDEILGPLHLPNGLPELESLDINSTSVTIGTLQHVIKCSPNLRFLNLELCRGLERKTRHVYHSRNAIEELLKHQEIDLV